MAVCPVCNQEMRAQVSCTAAPARIRWGQETLFAHRVQFAAQRGIEDPINNPVPHDDAEADDFFRLCRVGKYTTGPCPDCAVPVGGLHHPGCDTEECPDCHLQAIGCDCGGLERTLTEAEVDAPQEPVPVTAVQFARLSMSLGHDRADLEQTLAKRFPDCDPVAVVDQAEAWFRDEN
jgi:hypothetical protein